MTLESADSPIEQHAERPSLHTRLQILQPLPARITVRGRSTSKAVGERPQSQHEAGMATTHVCETNAHAMLRSQTHPTPAHPMLPHYARHPSSSDLRKGLLHAHVVSRGWDDSELRLASEWFGATFEDEGYSSLAELEGTDAFFQVLRKPTVKERDKRLRPLRFRSGLPLQLLLLAQQFGVLSSPLGASMTVFTMGGENTHAHGGPKLGTELLHVGRNHPCAACSSPSTPTS